MSFMRINSFTLFPTLECLENNPLGLAKIL
jgi:hypothetical protein